MYFKELYTQDIDKAMAESNDWNSTQVPRSCKKEWDFLSRVKAKVGLDKIFESKYANDFKQTFTLMNSKCPKFARSVQKRYFPSPVDKAMHS